MTFRLAATTIDSFGADEPATEAVDVDVDVEAEVEPTTHFDPTDESIDKRLVGV